MKNNNQIAVSYSRESKNERVGCVLLRSDLIKMEQVNNVYLYVTRRRKNESVLFHDVK